MSHKCRYNKNIYHSYNEATFTNENKNICECGRVLHTCDIAIEKDGYVSYVQFAEYNGGGKRHYSRRKCMSRVAIE